MLTTFLVLVILVLIRKVVRTAMYGEGSVKLGVVMMLPLFVLAARLIVRGLIREIVTGVRKDFTNYDHLHRG